MITYGLQAPPHLSALMAFTENELEKLRGPKLNKYCQNCDGRYIAKAMIGGKMVTGKRYDTIKECNLGQAEMIRLANKG